jgi:hypothetical protein
MQSSVTKISDFDISKVSFGGIPKSSGMKFINVLYENKPLSIRFGTKEERFLAPFGSSVSKMKNNDGTEGKPTFSVDIIIEKESETFNKLKQLEDLIVEHLVKNGKSIFNDDDMQERDVRKMMFPFLKFSYEKDDKGNKTKIVKTNANGDPYNPTLRNKCTVSKKTGEFSTLFVNEKGKEVDVPVDEEAFIDLIPSMSDVNVLTKFTVWCLEKTCGISSYLEQIRFFEREEMRGNVMVDSDSEGEDEVPVARTESEVEVEVGSESETASSKSTSSTKSSSSTKAVVKEAEEPKKEESKKDEPVIIKKETENEVESESDSDSESSESDDEPEPEPEPVKPKKTRASKSSAKKDLLEALKA